MLSTARSRVGTHCGRLPILYSTVSVVGECCHTQSSLSQVTFLGEKNFPQERPWMPKFRGFPAGTLPIRLTGCPSGRSNSRCLPAAVTDTIVSALSSWRLQLCLFLSLLFAPISSTPLRPARIIRIRNPFSPLSRPLSPSPIHSVQLTQIFGLRTMNHPACEYVSNGTSIATAAR